MNQRSIEELQAMHLSPPLAISVCQKPASKAQANSGLPTAIRIPESLGCSTVDIPLSLGVVSADTLPSSFGDAKPSVLSFIDVCVVLLVLYPIGLSC